jgi:hypothetical protein
VINTEIVVIIIQSFKMTGRLSTSHLKKEVEPAYEGTVYPPSFPCACKIWAVGRNSETTRNKG